MECAYGAGQARRPILQKELTDMLVIPGRRCHTCEGPTRRELLRAGSIGLFGLNLANFLAIQKTAKAAAKYEGARGFGSAKSVIMVFLQGGPSHIAIWDPKPDVARSEEHTSELQSRFGISYT